jgi:hypothetical protein
LFALAKSTKLLYFQSSQIAAVRYNPEEGKTLEEFSEYILPTGPVPLTASKVNGLFEIGGTLCKKTNGVLKELPACPARIVLERFVKWALSLEGDEEPKQVICIGYNNSSFDDHFLLDHWRKKLEPDLFAIVRRKIFTADMQKLLQLKGKLSDIFLQCGGTQEEVLCLHDALADCKAVATILRTKNVRLETICSGCRSFERVQQRSTNPLLKSGLITETVASKMVAQLTCEDYLRMEDSAVTQMFTALGVARNSINACLSKRAEYRAHNNVHRQSGS